MRIRATGSATRSGAWQLVAAGLLAAVAVGLVAFRAVATAEAETPPESAAAALEAGLEGLAVEPMPAPPADRILRDQSRALLDDPAALLRAATTALEHEDDAHADWLYAQVIARHPIVADHAALRRARLHLEAGRLVEARAIALASLDRDRTSPLRAELHAVVGEAHIAQQNEPAGRAAYRAALDSARDDERKAELLREIARSQERSGEDRDAGLTWQRIWVKHPTAEPARQAEHRLELIEAHLGESLRDASDWRRRGDRLFSLRRNDEALEAYDRALELGLSAAETRRLRKQRAHTLFRMRRYPEALAAFESLPQTGDTPIWTARSLARADRVPESIEAFRKLAGKGGAHSARAHYLAATLLDGRGRDDEARRHFEAVAKDPKRGSQAQAALWRLAWSDYRRGSHADAMRRFEALAASTADPIDRLRPRYWQARAQQALDPEAAQTAFAELAHRYPLSYYGWRARQRTDGVTPDREPIQVSKGRSGVAPAALERVRILMEAGFEEEGARETATLVRRARGLEDRVSLARLLTSAGDYNRAQRVIVDAYKETLAKGPVAGLEELWWYAWPSAFAEWVDEATRDDEHVEPELVFSIMREESGYRPKVISPVGARGLLQIMRETGATLASQRGRASFDPDELFDPRINIELGSFYLGELRRRFPSQISASVASYNAGPHVVINWVEEGRRADDEWVESIPYSQTRSYVKRVLRSLEAYRLLY